MNDTDMTERLRKIFSEIKEQAGDSADWLTQYDAIRFAADRIEALNRRLLAEENHVEILNIENGHLQTDRNNLELRVKELDGRLADCKASSLHGQSAMAQEVERLRAERDEARRIACKMEERAGCDESGCPKNGTAQDHATRRGWDCFKENTNG
jgi:hypothetical protein